MISKSRTLPAWLADELSLLTYLTDTHPGHPYSADLIDAIALVTSWLLVGAAVFGVMAVLIDAAFRL
jgi:hypothetical protein